MFHQCNVTCNSMKEAELLEEMLSEFVTSSNLTLSDDSEVVIYEGLCSEDVKANIIAAHALWQAAARCDAALQWRVLEEKNWVEEYSKTFPPMDIAGFYVYGSHVQPTIPHERIPVLMDAGMAFGTGDHATTQGCLRAIRWVNERFQQTPRRVLDVGTGTGILAIAAQKLWPDAVVIAGEIEPESVVIAKENSRINKTDTITFVEAAGLNHTSIQQNAPYNLIMANILAKPLIGIAFDVVNALSAQGYVILSGLIAPQRDEVLEAYENAGCNLVNEYLENNWVTLTLQKSF